MRLFVGFSIFLILVSLLSACSRDCKTAEEMNTEEITIKLDANPPRDKDGRPTWWSAPVFLAQNPNGQKFDILKVDADFCGADSGDLSIVHQKDVNISIANFIFDAAFGIVFGSSAVLSGVVETGMTFLPNLDQFIKVELIKKRIRIDCTNPGPNVYVDDIDKCKKGYWDTGDSGNFTPLFEGRDIEVDIGNGNEVNDNLILSKTALANWLPGKTLVIPEIFEYDDKTSGSTVKTSSFLPQIPDAHLSIMTNPLQYPTLKRSDIQYSYWCRKFGSRSKAGGDLNPTENVSAFRLNQFCDNFYALDLSGDTLSDCGDGAPNGRTATGNTNSTNPVKAIGLISDSCKRALPSGSSSADLSDLPANYQSDVANANSNLGNSMPIELNKFFYGLDLLIDTKSPINSDIKCDSPISRCDGAGKPQIPLNRFIKVENPGRLRARLTTENTALKNDLMASIAIANNNGVGLRFTRTCPATFLAVLILERGQTPIVKPWSSTVGGSVSIFPLFHSEAGATNFSDPIGEIEILKDQIPPNGANVYFAVLNPLATDDSTDKLAAHTGGVIIKTRVPRGDNNSLVVKLMKRITDAMEAILYGRSSDADGAGIVSGIYNRLVGSSGFRNLFNVFLVLFISTFALFSLMGLNQLQAGAIVKVIFKIGIIYSLFQPFSWNFFHNYLFSIFTVGAKGLLTGVMASDQTGELRGSLAVFSGIDKVYLRILSPEMWQQLLSLLFAFPFGWFALILIGFAFWSLLCAIAWATLGYFIAVIMIGLLISLAPLFILMLMFNYTTKIFKAWIKVLTANALVPIVVFAGLNMLAGVIANMMDDLFGYGVCTQCVLKFQDWICLMWAAVPDSTQALISIETRNLIQSARPDWKDVFFGLPFGFNKLLCFIIICHITRGVVDILNQLAAELSGLMYGAPTGSMTAEVADTLKAGFGGDRRAKEREAQGMKQNKLSATDIKAEGGSEGKSGDSNSSGKKR